MSFHSSSTIFKESLSNSESVTCNNSNLSESNPAIKNPIVNDTGYDCKTMSSPSSSTSEPYNHYVIPSPLPMSIYPKKSLQHVRLEEAICCPVADTRTLHELLWLGVPKEAEPHLRGCLWKLLLGYTPLAQETRQKSAIRKKQEYVEMYNKYVDHKTGELLSYLYSKPHKQITVDILRTNPSGFSSIFSDKRIQSAMINILLVWSIRNPASGYVQGLNDLLTPFIVVFLRQMLQKNQIQSNDIQTVRLIHRLKIVLFHYFKLTSEKLIHLEAECYWCLSKLLSRVQDNFVFGQPGIVRMINIMQTIVKRVDAALFTHLETQGIELFHVCFRWMNCFLIREMPLEAIIRLWDTYIAEGTSGFSEFHVYVCTVFLVYWSPRLKNMDFQQIMLFLQSVPTSNWGTTEMESLVAEAFVLKTLFHSAPKHLDR